MCWHHTNTLSWGGGRANEVEDVKGDVSLKWAKLPSITSIVKPKSLKGVINTRKNYCAIMIHTTNCFLGTQMGKSIKDGNEEHRPSTYYILNNKNRLPQSE